MTKVKTIDSKRTWLGSFAVLAEADQFIKQYAPTHPGNYYVVSASTWEHIVYRSIGVNNK